MPVPARGIADRFQAEAWAVLQRDLFQVALQHQREAFKLGVAKAEAELSTFDLFDPRAQGFAQEFEYQSIRSLTARTSVKVQDTLLDGIRQGLGVDEVTQALDAVLDGRVATVATIARTETNRAANAGRLSGWKKSGVVKQKEDIATLDDRVRPDHLAAHGEVAPIDAAFTRGAASGKLVPPWDPNCRCTVAPITRLTTGINEGEVIQDADAARTLADSLGFASPEERIRLAYERHRIPGLVAAEEAHLRALCAVWRGGRDRFRELLGEANR